MKDLKEKLLSNKRNLLLGLLIVGVLTMTIAFAAFVTRLTLNGTANVAATRWNIHFYNWQKVSIPTVTVGGQTHSNTAQSPEVLNLSMSDNSNVTKVTGVNVTLNQPGDTAKYTFEIKNEGTIDAKLDNFTVTDTTSNDLVDYEVKCFESSSREGTEVTQNSVLAAENGVAYCYLQVTYKDQTNSHTAGSNQVYHQDQISTNLTAQWTWVQADSSQSSGGGNTPTPSQICQGGQMIGTTNWCLTNPSASLQSQRFAYYENGTTQVMSGLQTINDLYGVSQTYYFVDGIAQVGLQTVNNNIYYFSDEDDDGNHYLNCNMLKNTTKTVSGTCYSFDSNGVGTANGTGCSAPSSWNKYYYYNTSTGSTGESDTKSNDWVLYVQANTNTGDREVCGKFNNGTTVCVKHGQYSCSNFNDSGCDKTYINSLASQFAAAGASLNTFNSNDYSIVYDEEDGNFVTCEFSHNGNVSFTAYVPGGGGDIACYSDNGSGTPYCSGL